MSGHEKKTLVSWLKNTRSGGIDQGREAPPQRTGKAERHNTDAAAEARIRIEREKG